MKTHEEILDELDETMGRILMYMNEKEWTDFINMETEDIYNGLAENKYIWEISKRKKKLNLARSKAQTLTNSFKKTFVATRFGHEDFVIATPLKM